MNKHLAPKLLLLAFVFTSVLACGLPTASLGDSPNYPTLTAAPVPVRFHFITESPAPSERLACWSLWVRAGAGIQYEVLGFAMRDDVLYLTGNERKASDGGVWLQVEGRDGLAGWVNGRLLCEVEK